jgi:hypothetical protein
MRIRNSSNIAVSVYNVPQLPHRNTRSIFPDKQSNDSSHSRHIVFFKAAPYTRFERHYSSSSTQHPSHIPHLWVAHSSGGNSSTIFPFTRAYRFLHATQQYTTTSPLRQSSPRGQPKQCSRISHPLHFFFTRQHPLTPTRTAPSVDVVCAQISTRGVGNVFGYS